jgi:hypothetical protein
MIYLPHQPIDRIASLALKSLSAFLFGLEHIDILIIITKALSA